MSSGTVKITRNETEAELQKVEGSITYPMRVTTEFCAFRFVLPSKESWNIYENKNIGRGSAIEADILRSLESQL